MLRHTKPSSAGTTQVSSVPSSNVLPFIPIPGVQGFVFCFLLFFFFFSSLQLPPGARMETNRWKLNNKFQNAHPSHKRHLFTQGWVFKAQMSEHSVLQVLGKHPSHQCPSTELPNGSHTAYPNSLSPASGHSLGPSATTSIPRGNCS